MLNLYELDLTKYLNILFQNKKNIKKSLIVVAIILFF